nr:hypothetical protein [Tanacetum cinerariifolium]
MASGILKAFIIGIENLIDHKVKIIRCDNKTEFKNKEMNQFCDEKWIKREFSVATTSQQYGADEGFFVGYSMNSKAFRVFNSRTRIVEETLHITFLKNKTDVAGSGPTWLFDIDKLTKSMNYKPVLTGNQSNGSAGKAIVETIPDKDYILLPFWTQDPLFSSSSKVSPGDGFKPSGDEEKKDAKDLRNDHNEVLSTEEPRVNQEKDANVNSTNNINTVSPTANAASTKDNAIDKDVVFECDDDPNMPNWEEINYLDDDKNVGAEANMTNLDSNIHMDVKSAFLYERIEEEVYVCQTLGFKDLEFPNRVYKVEKALYGLHQAPRAWKEMCTEFEKMMHKKFQMSSMGELTFFLGPQTASTPMKTSKPLLKDENAEDVDVYLYRSMISSLMYFTSSRPDIMFAVCVCARFQVTPKVLHLHAMKRILRYLKGQPKLGLWYLKDSPFDLEAYTDSDYASASLDMKSITGGCQFLRNRLISWQCKKQTVVANSTTEANRLLEKPTESEGFEQIVDFLNANPIRYALTVNLTIYTSCIKPFWATAKVNTVNEEEQIQALVDKKKVIITETSNLEGGVKFLMFPRFVQVFLDKQVEGVFKHKEIYVTPSHSKKVFANMKRHGKDFSRRVTPLFPTMLMQAQQEVDEGTAIPTDTKQTPTIIQPTTSQPQRKQKTKKPRRKDTEVSTTDTGLDVEQARGIISKTQFMATLNEPSSIRISSGSRPRHQETMRDADAQTRSERVFKFSNDIHLSRVNTLRSEEDRLKLSELMELYTQLQTRVLALETIKTNQALEIGSLKRRVNKLEKKASKRTHKLKRLDKIESKELISPSLDEFIENLKVHEMIIKKDSKIVKAKGERKSLALKAKKESSNEECLTFGSKYEEYAMAVGDFKMFFKIREFPKQPKDKNQRAFAKGSWSDNGEKDNEKVKDKTCLIAQASSEVPQDYDISSATPCYLFILFMLCPYIRSLSVMLSRISFHVLYGRRVKESLNMTFDEIPPPSKTSPLVDDDLDEKEAITVTKKKNLENDIEDETLKIDEIVNIKESRNHPLENVIGNLNQRSLRSQAQNQKMLKKFALEEFKSMKTPMSFDTKLMKDEECESVDSTKYRAMIEFAQILDIPYEGAYVFTNKWSLNELAYGVPTDGPYRTSPPSPDDIILYIRIDQEGQVCRIRHEQEIDAN